jgi:DNA repair protein RecN (Recombination protein N)
VLRELSVQNLALIEDVRVELHDGYCAWTGETGAGKSLLLTALGLVLGGKASADLVRGGKEEARASAVFDLSDDRLRGEVASVLGGAIDEDQLVLTRRVGKAGRSAAHANGMPVAVATLRQLGSLLLDIHGQHETLALLDADHQRNLLDAHARLESRLEAYQVAREAHDTLRRRRIELIAAVDRRHRERDLLAFELEELNAAEPRAGEHEELTREANRLASAEEVREAAAEGYELLYEADDSVQELLARVARRISPLADSVPELAGLAADLERLAEESREAARTLRQFNQEWDDDPERLEAIETRLALYRRLGTRFRCTPDELAQRRDAVAAQLSALDRDNADLAALAGPLAEAWNDMKAAANALSEARRKASKAFA